MTKQTLFRAVLLTSVRRLARTITYRAHVRPSLWCVAVNDDWPIEAWQ